MVKNNFSTLGDMKSCPTLSQSNIQILEIFNPTQVDVTLFFYYKGV